MSQIIAGILGLWLAAKYVAGVTFSGPFIYIPKSIAEISGLLGTLAVVGIFLGILNSFIKPILNTLTLPLRIITLNLFSLVIAMLIVWVVNLFSAELSIQGIKALFWTTVIVWILNIIFSLFSAKK